jgi:hypothetical protein
MKSDKWTIRKWGGAWVLFSPKGKWAASRMTHAGAVESLNTRLRRARRKGARP